MLRFLRIRNLAVIEAVDVEFDPGFNVLTGGFGIPIERTAEFIDTLDNIGRGRPLANSVALSERCSFRLGKALQSVSQPGQSDIVRAC